MNTMQALGHKEPTQLGNEVNQVQERQAHAWLYCQCMCRNATQSTGERGLWNGQLMTGTRVWNVRTVGLGHDKATGFRLEGWVSHRLVYWTTTLSHRFRGLEI